MQTLAVGCGAGFSGDRVDAGLPVDQIAEQYLRAAMERAVAAVEPARLEAEEVPWLLDNVLAPLGGAVVFSHGDLNVSPVPLAR